MSNSVEFRKDKSYDLSQVAELMMFEDDCREACCSCPQYMPPAELDKGSMASIAEVFYGWFFSDTLWRSGYANDLSDEAKATFRRYAVIRGGVVHDLKTGVTYDPLDRFVVARQYWKKTNE